MTARRGVLALAATSLALIGFAEEPPAIAAYPGQNGRIAFLSTRTSDAFRVFVIDADGRNARPFIDSATAARPPRWSPDGRRLAFYGTIRRRGGGIVTATPAGRVLRILRTKGLVVSGLSWSPDATRFVLAAARLPSRRNDLYLLDVWGGQAVRLTKTSDCESEPAWSPDGRWIAFEAGCGSIMSRGLEVIRTTGTGRRRLTTFAQEPNWSPDGTKIVFRRGTRPYVFDVSAGVDHGLATVPVPRGRIAWSPDGIHLLFPGEEENPCDARSLVARLFVANVDGTGQRRVSATCKNDIEPDWQPVCTITGSARPDQIIGTSGNDVICSLAGADRVQAGGGADVILGGDGADVIDGGLGVDRIFGATGADILRARDAATDVVDGGPGRDSAQIDSGDTVTSIERTLP